jgi:transposase
LAEATSADPVVQKLLETKGVGIVTACTLRAEIGRFDRFRTGKQLARFCGTSPRNASSGQRQADAGLVKASNPELRRVLIETAHRLMLHDDKWHALGQELRKRGKAGSVAAAAVANRWIRWLHHQMLTIHTAA